MKPLTPIVVGLLLTGCAGRSAPEHSPGCGQPLSPLQIAALLQTFHDAASRADFNAYFDCFTPDGVFLGTDATERWTVDEFKAYCKPYFDAGKGWTYTPRPGSRHLRLDSVTTPRIAWFDELLENEKYGTCRGSGVLIRGDDGQWRIAQYNLAFMVPNETAAQVTAITNVRK